MNQSTVYLIAYVATFLVPGMFAVGVEIASGNGGPLLVPLYVVSMLAGSAVIFASPWSKPSKYMAFVALCTGSWMQMFAALWALRLVL